MIFDVTLYLNGTYKVSVEAKDEERAEERAIDNLSHFIPEVQFEVNDAVVTKSSNQYTDEQELSDGERRKETKG